MSAGGFWIDRSTVVMGMVVTPLLISHHLEGLTQIHQCRGKPSETCYPSQREEE